MGSNYETGTIEVSSPKGYEGPSNYDAFREGAEKYYRSCFGSQGTGIRIGKGSKVRMRNNIVVKKMVFEFKVSSTHSP